MAMVKVTAKATSAVRERKTANSVNRMGDIIPALSPSGWGHLHKQVNIGCNMVSFLPCRLNLLVSALDCAPRCRHHLARPERACYAPAGLWEYADFYQFAVLTKQSKINVLTRCNAMAVDFEDR